MSGCATCGGFGDRHDPIAHGTEPDLLAEITFVCRDCDEDWISCNCPDGPS